MLVRRHAGTHGGPAGCVLRADAASAAGTDADRVSFTVTVRVARDHAAAAQAAGQARHHAIRDILADLLPGRRDGQCERVKKPPRNTFPVKKRGQTPPATKATYVITITRKRATASQYVLIHWHCRSKALFHYR
jgi:hypothetical protein